jgi:Tol biopolymer transport system component
MTKTLLLALLFTLFIARAAPAHTQEDGLNLPTELYTLLRDGSIQRFGLGAAGVAEVTPTGGAAIDFGLSPDGVWLAYRTEAGALNIYHMLTGENRPIDAQAGYPPYRGRGESIAWSPDGAAIAYTRDGGLRAAFFGGITTDVSVSPVLTLAWSPDGRFLAAETENDVWWVYRRDGTQLVLHAALPSSRGAAWVSNTLLMIAPAEGGLFVLDTANANQQIALADARKQYQKPARRPDGSVVVFGKQPNDTRITEGAAFLHEVRTTVSGIEVTQVSQTSVDLTGLRWTPGGRLMVTLQGGVVVLVDPLSAQGFPLPLTDVAAYAWGAVRLPSIPNLPLTAPVHFLADDGTGAAQVWQLPADGGPAVPLTAHPTPITAFDVAPDGRTLAYISENTLWILPPNTDTPTPLYQSADTLLSSPRFDASGAAVAFQAGAQIVLADLSGSTPPTPLLTDYRLLGFASAAGGLLVTLPDGDLGFYAQTSGEVRRLGAFRQAKPLPDGRILAVGAVTPDQPSGLYLIDLQAPEPALFYAAPAGFTLSDFAPLAAGPVRVLLTRADSLPAPLRVFDVTPTGGAVAIPALPYLEGARISTDGGTLAGYASGAGNLAVYNIALAAETIPFIPARVEGVQFPPFR